MGILVNAEAAMLVEVLIFVDFYLFCGLLLSGDLNSFLSIIKTITGFLPA